MSVFKWIKTFPNWRGKSIKGLNLKFFFGEDSNFRKQTRTRGQNTNQDIIFHFHSLCKCKILDLFTFSFICWHGSLCWTDKSPAGPHEGTCAVQQTCRLTLEWPPWPVSGQAPSVWTDLLLWLHSSFIPAVSTVKAGMSLFIFAGCEPHFPLSVNENILILIWCIQASWKVRHAVDHHQVNGVTPGEQSRTREDSSCTWRGCRASPLRNNSCKGLRITYS